MSTSPAPRRRAALFRNGRNQAVRIPREFELNGTEVLVIKDGERLILEPIRPRGRLLAVLAEMEPLAEEFPDLDEGLGPPEDSALSSWHSTTFSTPTYCCLSCASQVVRRRSTSHALATTPYARVWSSRASSALEPCGVVRRV